MARDNLCALFVLTLVAGGCVLPSFAEAAPPPLRDLETCQRLAQKSPVETLKRIPEWLGHGGGEQAQLCRAVALFQNGEFAEAGEDFEALAGGGKRNERQIADLYDRAAWAFLRAGDGARADQLYSRALEKQPEDIELLVDRGIGRAESRKFRDAITDFSAALKRDRYRPDVYYFRAAAYRELMDLKNAREDVEQSLRLRPGYAEALVLRGTVRSLSGDTAGARLDWQEAARRDPHSPSGISAAASLKQLDEAASKPAGKP